MPYPPERADGKIESVITSLEMFALPTPERLPPPRAGLTIVDVDDGVPWLRPHGARHVEVYLVRVIVAERRGRRR